MLTSIDSFYLSQLNANSVLNKSCCDWQSPFLMELKLQCKHKQHSLKKLAAINYLALIPEASTRWVYCHSIYTHSCPIPLAAWQSTFIAHLQLKETSTCNFPLSISKSTFEMGALWPDGRMGWATGGMGGKQMKSVPNKQQHPIKRAARRRQLLLFTPFVRTSTTKYANVCARHTRLLTSSHMSCAEAQCD